MRCVRGGGGLLRFGRCAPCAAAHPHPEDWVLKGTFLLVRNRGHFFCADIRRPPHEARSSCCNTSIRFGSRCRDTCPRSAAVCYDMGMSSEPTEFQNPEEQRRARQLSLQSTRPPGKRRVTRSSGAWARALTAKSGWPRTATRAGGWRSSSTCTAAGWTGRCSRGRWRSWSSCPPIATWCSCWTSAGTPSRRTT